MTVAEFYQETDLLPPNCAGQANIMCNIVGREFQTYPIRDNTRIVPKDLVSHLKTLQSKYG